AQPPDPGAKPRLAGEGGRGAGGRIRPAGDVQLVLPARAIDAQRGFGPSFEAAFGDVLAALDALAVATVLDPLERAADRGDVVRDHRRLAFERLVVLHLHRPFGRIGV